MVLNNNLNEAQDAEIKQKKHSSTPSEHLIHLLNIGWEPKSPLIVKYVMANNLEQELNTWLKEKSLKK